MQTVVVPSYFYPGPLWDRLEARYPTVRVIIINPDTGPGRVLNTDYADRVRRVRRRGLTVLGYVHTSYAERPLADVIEDIDAYREWYHVDGIFVDETPVSCAHRQYYATVNEYIKDHPGYGTGGATALRGGLTVINPGRQTEECYMSVADVIVTFENTFQIYVSDYIAPRWVEAYPPNRFWHLVYDAPTAADMTEAVRLSRQRRAGSVYVTPKRAPNPWDGPPPDQYWKAEIAAVR